LLPRTAVACAIGTQIVPGALRRTSPSGTRIWSGLVASSNAAVQPEPSAPPLTT
jgi:hypothetical protein